MLLLRSSRGDGKGSGGSLTLFIGSGGWIRTSDLWVMSPTSYQTAPPRTVSSYLNLILSVEGVIVKRYETQVLFR